MIKILTTRQSKELDAYTIQHEPIASIDLMERACRAFCSWFTDHIDPSKRVGIVCGTGNNGGDGLGIARLLKAWDYTVSVWIVHGLVKESDDFTINLKRLDGKVPITAIGESPTGDIFSDCDVLIDGIFGSGLSRPPEGIYADVIRSINASPAIKIAIDIPSGLMTDTPSDEPIIRAHYTVTFQIPKLAFLLPDGHPYVGEWVLVDIGLSKEKLNQSTTNNCLLTRRYIQRQLLPQRKFDHKGTRGKALLISGGLGKMGAAVLASRAALRTGLGLLTTHIPRCGYSIIQTSIPEAMASVDRDEFLFTTAPETDPYSAVGIGPGIGTDKRTVTAFTKVLEKSNKPFVIDADGLNIIGEHRHLISTIPSESILTPHPKEFERIAGPSRNGFEQLDKLRELAFKQNLIIVLKGAHTAIATPRGDVCFNNTGNPAMATGGSGDVLTGMILSLLAQGYPPLTSAQVGVWLHGLAADLAAETIGKRGLIASDFVECIPKAYLRIA